MIIVALHSIPCWSSWCALWEKCQGENRGVTKLHRSLAGAVYRLPQFGKRVYIEVLEPRAGSGVRAWCMVGQGDSLFTMEMNMKHAGMAGRPRDGNEGIHAAHAVYGNGIFLEHIITHGKTLEYTVELRTPATPVGVGGGKERGGCHLNLRTWHAEGRRPILGLCWPSLGLCWPILRLCWPMPMRTKCCNLQHFALWDGKNPCKYNSFSPRKWLKHSYLQSFVHITIFDFLKNV